MKGNMPIISVIIPTHNRCASLNRTLDALCSQTYTLQQVEVIVVADGCTDGTMEMLRHYRTPYTLRFFELSKQGPAAARNHGADHTTSPLLLFLDDDVEPTTTLIEAHVCAHMRQSCQVVIGPYPPVFHSASFFHIELMAWWKNVFNTMLQPGHRFTYRDLLSGNFSLEAKLFIRIGGFDTALWAHEDYELGMRLIKAGVQFTIISEAMGYHHDKSDPDRSLLRKRQEGRADVLMARRHPELLQTLPLVRFVMSGSSLSRFLQTLAFGWSTFSDALATRLRHLLDLLERMGLRCYWRRLYRVLKSYWYLRGVAEELGTRQALVDFVKGCQAHSNGNGPIVELDLREGLEAAEQRLDKERPIMVRIRYGQLPIGIIPLQPGSELLRGIHLRTILVNTLAVPLLEALALEGSITTSATVDRHKLSHSIKSLSPWFGPMKPGKMWFEQYSQWNRLESERSEKTPVLRKYWNRFSKQVSETAQLEDHQVAYWQRLAKDRERIIQKQMTLTKELKRDKSSLDA